MIKNNSKAASRKRIRWGIVVGPVVLGLASLAGCSSVPDAVNPVEWYRGTVDYISGEKQPAAQPQDQQQAQNTLVADRAAPPPGADKPFPKLSSVPERPQPGKQVAQGLSADTQQRQYSTEPIQRQGVESAPPPPPTPAVGE